MDKTRAMTKFPKPSDTLFQDLRSLIIEARQDVARRVNSALAVLYWRVGKRIRQDIPKEKRAEYGEEILSTLSRKLAAEFGNGFSTRNLWHMIGFAIPRRENCELTEYTIRLDAFPTYHRFK